MTYATSTQNTKHTTHMTSTQHNTTKHTTHTQNMTSVWHQVVNLSLFVPHRHTVCLPSCGRYLGGGGEPAAEGVEDAEAVVQSERLSVFTEEVDQLAAFFLQLLPTAAQRAQR